MAKRNLKTLGALLLERVVYDPETGVFSWNPEYLRSIESRPRYGRKLSPSPGHVASPGYLRFFFSSGKEHFRVYAHRCAWFFVTGRWPLGEVDHINGDRADNRIANLRDVSHRANLCNNKKVRAGKKLPGVSYDRPNKSWKAQIRDNGKYRAIGYSKTEEGAHQLYIAELEKMGDYVTLQVVTGEKTPCQR